MIQAGTISDCSCEASLNDNVSYVSKFIASLITVMHFIWRVSLCKCMTLCACACAEQDCGRGNWNGRRVYHAWMENIGGCGELVGVVDGWERWMGGCFERVERMWK